MPASAWGATWQASNGPDGTVFDTAEALPGNRVVVLLPFNGRETEVLDVATMKWHRGGSTTNLHDDGAAVKLLAGDVMVAGGTDAAGNRTASVEIFDATTESFRAAAPLSAPRKRMALVLLASGKVIAIGGHEAAGSVATVESYDPTSNSWTRRASAPSTMLAPRALALADGRALATYLNQFSIFDPAKNVWTGVPSPAVKPTTAPYEDRLVQLPDGRVLYVTSRLDANDHILDPKTLSWTPLPRSDAASARGAPVVLTTGRVLVAGSLTGLSTFTPSAELFDPVSNSWQVVPPMATSRGGASSVALADGRAVVTGAKSPGSFMAPSTEIYQPAVAGSPCGVGGECLSGACSDGTCCDRVCAGDCERCDTPTAKGVCTAVEGDLNHCAAGFVCVGATCVASSGATCDGEELRSVSKEGRVQDCAPYRCNRATGDCFPAPCAQTAECAVGFGCDPDSRTCTRPAGTTASGCHASTAARGELDSAVVLGVLLLLTRVRRSRHVQGSRR